jgi:hypothetical protein
MFPIIIDRPLNYFVSQLFSSDLEHVVIVTARRKSAIKVCFHRAIGPGALTGARAAAGQAESSGENRPAVVWQECQERRSIPGCAGGRLPHSGEGESAAVEMRDWSARE